MKSLGVLLAISALAATGCGDGQMHVWGDVTYAGEPVEKGMIEFIPIDNTPGGSTGGTITNGHFDVPAKIGPLSGGTYKVAITWVRPTGRMVLDPLDHSKQIPELANCIPLHYGVNTTLRVTIPHRAASSRHDFHLEKNAQAHESRR